MELIVVADEAESVIAELNANLDRLEERHMIFGGGIECVAVEHPGPRKKITRMHTRATAGDVLRMAGEKMAVALKQII